jgi:osmotically-inducible protein OsmY
MKKIISLLALASLATSTLMLASGCSSTPTHASTGEYIDDSVITTKVKADLIHDDNTPGSAIKVETFKGTVQLSGFVDTEAQKKRAGFLAAQVSGVHDVVNNITVK